MILVFFLCLVAVFIVLLIMVESRLRNPALYHHLLLCRLDVLRMFSSLFWRCGEVLFIKTFFKELFLPVRSRVDGLWSRVIGLL